MEQINSDIRDMVLRKGCDISEDIVEARIDNILEDEVLKEIPIIKTVKFLYNIGLAIREGLFVRNLLTVMAMLRKSEIDNEHFEQFLKKYRSDANFQNKVNEHLILFCERTSESRKAMVYGKVFSAYIDKKVSWERLTVIAHCLEIMNPTAFNHLIKVAEKGFIDKGGKGNSRDFEQESYLLGSGLAYKQSGWASDFVINDIGKDLYEFGLK